MYHFHLVLTVILHYQRSCLCRYLSIYEGTSVWVCVDILRILHAYMHACASKKDMQAFALDLFLFACTSPAYTWTCMCIHTLACARACAHTHTHTNRVYIDLHCELASVAYKM